jgi:hypothetical protein
MARGPEALPPMGKVPAQLIQSATERSRNTGSETRRECEAKAIHHCQRQSSLFVGADQPRRIDPCPGEAFRRF